MLERKVGTWNRKNPKAEGIFPMPLGMQQERKRASSKDGFGSKWGACRKGCQGSAELTLAESLSLNLNVVMRRPMVMCKTTEY